MGEPLEILEKNMAKELECGWNVLIKGLDVEVMFMMRLHAGSYIGD